MTLAPSCATRAGLLKLGFPEILGNLYVYCDDVLLFFCFCFVTQGNTITNLSYSIGITSSVCY